jgi:hypothetical protein
LFYITPLKGKKFKQLFCIFFKKIYCGILTQSGVEFLGKILTKNEPEKKGKNKLIGLKHIIAYV